MNSIKNQNVAYQEVWKDTELFNADFQLPQATIENILYDGVTVLGGSPKIGKSILVEQIAYSVATGLPLFGNKAQQGDVLYLNLESDPVNALARRKAMELPGTGSVHYHFGGDVSLRNIPGLVARNAKSSLRLIIIDTLQHIRECLTPVQEYSYHQAVQDLNILQNLSAELSVPILIVHHTKKDSDSLLGSQGIFATVSSKLILLRDEGTRSGQLSICSRFQPENKINLKFNNKPLRWELEEEELGEITLDPIVSAVMAFLAKQEKRLWEGTAQRLWEEANLASLCVDPARLGRYIGQHNEDFVRSEIKMTKRILKGKNVYLLDWR